MLNIKNKFVSLIKDLDFKVISLIYFIGSIVIIFNLSSLTSGRLFLTICILISIAFLSCAYQHKKNTIERMIKNDIIKWVATGLTFSICLWYAKHKLNYDYEIEPEFLNYSAYGYAFAIAIPLFSFIYGICVFAYIYLRRITAYQSFYASIIILPLSIILEKPIKEYPAHNLIILIILLIFISIGIIKMLTIVKKKDGNNILRVFKIIKKDFKRRLLILKILFKKIILIIDVCLNVITLFSISTSLVFVGLSAIKLIPEHQQSFLLLDAFNITNCNKDKDSFLYLRKSKEECYKIKADGQEIIEMKKISSQGNQ